MNCILVVHLIAGGDATQPCQNKKTKAKHFVICFRFFYYPEVK
jgi:hypothetical protein